MLDPDYRQRVETALITSIVDASIVEVDGQRIAAVRMAELIEATVGVLASMISTSTSVATPEQRGAFAEEVAKRLSARIARCRQHHEEHGMPFHTVPAEMGTC